MRFVAAIALTLVKLAFALAILALGWMVFSPATTGGWPLAHALSPLIAGLIARFPLERAGWGVLLLALGAASVLAALPKKVVARSRRRIAPTLQPVAYEAAPEAHEIEAPQRVDPPQETEAQHAQPVLVDLAPPETSEHTPSVATVEHAAIAAPWEFPLISPLAATHSGSEAPGVSEPVVVSGPVAEDGADTSHLSDAAIHQTPVLDAAPSHEDALADARATLVAHPGAAARSHLADLLKKSGDIEESEGRLGPAIEAYEQSLALRREVVAEQPGDARETRWLWMTLETLAECRDDRGHHTQAAALYREGLAVGEHALSLAPEDAQYAQDLAATRARLAELEAQTTA